MDPLRGATPPPGIPGPCQAGGTSVRQEPNGDHADCVISGLAHQDGETITDPNPGTPHTGWAHNPFVEGEVADECNLHGVVEAVASASGLRPSASRPCSR
jgi:hypothetical protein